MPNQINASILEFLRAKGPHLDLAIAEALKVPLAKVRAHVADLASFGDLICCDAEGTDVQTVYQDRKISLTPLTLDSTARIDFKQIDCLL